MVLLPLYDRNPTHRIPYQYVTAALIVACVAVYLVQTSLSVRGANEMILGLAVIPRVLTGGIRLAPELVLVPAWLTLVTSAFLHGGFFHLAGNMLYLWIFGDNIEDAMGHVRFIAFYAICAAVAALVQVAADPASEIPLIGASGAISGVLGAYLVLHPRRKVWVLIIFRVVPLPVWLVLGTWIAFQVGSVAVLAGPGDNTAWWAHIGGFLAGMALIVPMRHKSVPLFDRARHPGPWGGGG